MKLIFTILTLLFSSVVHAQQNILLIIADDYGADFSSVYTAGNHIPPTPTIQGLSDNGVKFERAWAQPSCAPTRATILTGRYGFRTGVGVPGDIVSLDEFTIAQGLKAAGYRTACIGKWHLGARNDNDNPNDLGYDHYEGPISGGINNYFNWEKVTNGVVTSSVTTYATTEQVNNARDWITAQEDNPWFCQLALNAPHSPFHTPPSNLHSFEGNLTTDTQRYQAMVEAMDTEIGRLLASIPSATLANTNIIFIGDNGTPRQVSPEVIRDDKGSLYEGGVHVPFVVSGPIVSSPGRTVDANIHTVDLFETVLDIAGVHSDDFKPADTIIDSVSFRQYLTNPTQENFHRYNFADTFRTPVRAIDGVAITDGDYKLIRFQSGNEELYQISVDADESDDLNTNQITNIQRDALNNLQSILDSLENGDVVDRGANEPSDSIGAAYENWASAHGVSGASVGLVNDEDNDRLPNLLEFVLNGDPGVNDSTAILPSVVSTSTGNTFEFTRRTDSTVDIIQTIQYSNDLITWRDQPANDASNMVTVSPNPNNSDLEDVSFPLQSVEGNGQKVFVRLMVRP